LQLVIALLLAAVMCWMGEPTSPLEALHHGDPAVERSPADEAPMGKPAGPSAEELADKAETVDDADSDALLVIETPLEVPRGFGLRHFAQSRELNDWRARSSIGARGPPVA
jgi:hypothetical protein